LPRQVAEGELHIHLPLRKFPLLGQLAEAVQLLRHPAQDFLQKVLAEVPVVHLQIDVFLDDRVASLPKDGGEGWEAEIGFGGEPIGREDEQNLHLPAAGGFRGLSMELNQLLRRPLALRVLDAHAGLLSYRSQTEKDQKANELDYKDSLFYGRGGRRVKGGRAAGHPHWSCAPGTR